VWPLADSNHVTNLLISASDITLQGGHPPFYICTQIVVVIVVVVAVVVIVVAYYVYVYVYYVRALLQEVMAPFSSTCTALGCKSCKAYLPSTQGETQHSLKNPPACFFIR
jgi:Na+/H+-dicarboxylate symporter